MENEKEKAKEKEREKTKSNPIDRAKNFAQTLSNKIKHKKATGERTRGFVKSDRVGLAKGPNTLMNRGKVSK